MNKHALPQQIEDDEYAAVGAMCLPDLCRLTVTHDRPALLRGSSWPAPATRKPETAPTRVILVRPGWA